ncbi:MAG TPA: hypothetical protein ENG75_07135, partial [Nitrospirae bacterium]|nr:hypothetical protein [Nitrospirota bacterium]
MNLIAFSSVLICVTNIFIAILVLLKGKNTRVNIIWAILCIFISIWGIGSYKFSTVLTIEEAFFWQQIANIGSIFIPITFYHFLYAFLKLNKKYQTNILITAYILGFVFLTFDLFIPQYFIGEPKLVFDHIYILQFSKNNPLYLSFYIIFYLVLLLYSFSELIISYRKSRGTYKNQLRFLVVASIVGWIGGDGYFLTVINNDIYPILNFAIAIYPLIVAYAILRYRLMDINLVFRKSMVYSLSAGLLTGIFLLLIMIMSNYISDLTGHASLGVSCIAALIIAMLFNPLKNRIQLLIDKVFYKTRYDYYSTIQKAGSDLVELIRAGDIQDYILQLIFKTLKVKSAYFLSIDGECFKGAITRFSNNKLSTEEITQELDKNSELVRLLKTGKDIVIKEELAEVVENDEFDIIAEELKPFNGKIAVPFFIEDRLSFILILGEKLSGDFYSDEDINLLSTISSQAAVSLKNAMLYGELEQRVEDRTGELSYANKQLEDFTKVVSHDLQEPLWKVKMFGDRLKAGYAEVLEGKGRDYMERMYSAITRMQRLINDLLALSRVTIGVQPNISVDLNR